MFKGSILLSLIAGACLWGYSFIGNPATTTTSVEDGSEKEKILMQTILAGLRQLHYKPAALDNQFSEKAFDLHLKYLDSRKRFLTKEDVDALRKYRLELDEQVKDSDYAYFDFAVNLIDKRIKEARGVYEEIMKEDFNFNQSDKIQANVLKMDYPKNKTELRKYWERLMKYEVLSRVVDKEMGQKDKDEKKAQDELKEKAIEDVKKLYDDWFKRLVDMDRFDRLNDYLNAVVGVYDPHTVYFAPIEKENFDISMSGRLEGIGARLSAEDEFTKVVSIVPGSACWKQGELEVNDLILKVGQGEEEPVDVVGMKLNDVVKKIRGKKGTEVRLTVKKVDGSTAIIPIIRDVVILEEGYAKSAILKTDENKKIGLINLPKFYADFSGRGGRNCAVDVKNEIDKLQEDKVDGIIIDLRNNSGGSLRDVVTMSGYFIEEGPIVQVKGRHTSPQILEDTDSRVQYDGPLVILVNYFSASASEILAASLQDYGRAIVVGSKSTFGKGTVQRFIELDNAISNYEEIKPLGSLKLTIQKFYRVNGGATQLKGVVPDIVLPDRYQYIKVGEQEEEYPLEWSEIAPVEYTQNVLKIDNMEKIRKASEQRVAKNEAFQLITQNARRLQRLREIETEYPLEYNTYKTLVEKRKAESKAFEDLSQKTEGLSVLQTAADALDMKGDTTKQARFDDWKDNIAEDVYLGETLEIIDDMIEMN